MVVVALLALVAMSTACQNWSQFLGNPALTGEAPDETAHHRRPTWRP